MIQVSMQSTPALTEATAKFVVMGNGFGGIWRYDQGGLARPRVATGGRGGALVRYGKKTRTSRALDKQVRRLLRIAWQAELAARVSDAYDDGMLRCVAARTLLVQAYYAVLERLPTSTAAQRLSYVSTK
jgi:hypothetical protein